VDLAAAYLWQGNRPEEKQILTSMDAGCYCFPDEKSIFIDNLGK